MDGGMGLTKVARANIRRHPGRAALMVVGMAVAVAAFVTVVSLVLSLRSTMDDRLARYGANLVVAPADPELSLQYGGLSVADAGSGEVPVLSDRAVAAIRGIPSAARVAEVVPVLLQPVEVAAGAAAGAAASGGAGAAAGASGAAPPAASGAPGGTFLAVGTDVAAELRAKPWWRIEGAAPNGPDQVLLGLAARNRLGSDPGETLSIDGREYTVSGVLWETGGDEDGAVFMDREELAALTGREGELNLVEVVAGDSAAVEPLQDEITQALPAAEVISVKKSLEFNAQTDSALGRFGLAATALIVIMAAFIVALTMLAAVRERQREIGVLRAIGYRRRDIWTLLLTESLLLSVGAAVLGAGLGLAGAALGPRLAEGLSLQFGPSLLVVGAGMALAVVLAVVATLYPASRAARLDPAAALRSI